jgi:hypothetical protein
MALGANTPTNLASRFKQRYNKEISQIVPMTADILRTVKFRNDLALGASAEFDVQLAPELGFSQGQGSVTLNGANTQATARATVGGYSLILQSQVSYDAIARAKSTDQAFASFSDSKFIPMVDSFRMREEYHALLGRDQGLGKITANSSGTLTISEDTFIPALASSLIGAVLQAWTAKLTATTASGSQHNGDLTVTAVNITNRTITVSGTSAAVVANDYLYFKGDYTVTSRIGLLSIAQNSGSLFGISATTYPLWSANTYSLGTSAITLGKILDGAAKSAEKGCVGKKLVCYVPVSAFQKLVSDEAALVTYGASKSNKAENGFEYLTFLGASGTIEVKPHLFIPDGVSLLWCPEYTYVIGSTEATAQIAKDGDIIFDLESTSAKEMRMFSDTVGVFCERPGFMVYMTRSDSLKLSA